MSSGEVERWRDPQTSPHGQSDFTRRSFSASAAAGTGLVLDLERCAEHFLVGGLLLVGQLRFDLGEGFLAVLVRVFAWVPSGSLWMFWKSARISVFEACTIESMSLFWASVSLSLVWTCSSVKAWRPGLGGESGEAVELLLAQECRGACVGLVVEFLVDLTHLA